MSAFPGPKPTTPKLSTFLRDQRRERGWSQRQLCAEAGIYLGGPGGNGTRVAQVEQEHEHGLSRDMAERLGAALDCRKELLLLSGFAPEPSIFDQLEPALARAICQAVLAGVDQSEIAAVLCGVRA